MKHFVIHYPKLKNRKDSLVRHLEERGVTDVEWVEGFNVDDPFVNWLSNYVGNTLPMGHFSCSVKHFHILHQMLERGIKEAIIFEDDVVLHKDFGTIQIPPRLMLVKLGIGVNFQMTPGTTPQVINNLGGNEANYVTDEFARTFLNQVHFGHSADIVYQAFLMHENHPLVCIPVCHQTSLLDGASTCAGTMPNWIEYIRSWSTLKKYKWTDLLAEYSKVSKVEDEFEKNFGVRIKLTNMEFIRQRLGVV